MTEYLNQAEYMRWMRHYQNSLDNYLARIAAIHQIVDTAPEDAASTFPGLREEIERTLDEIEAKLEDAMPRDFSENAEPLRGIAVFAEDIKLILNMFFKLFNRPPPFKGIYEAEKERVQQVHQSFKFKDKLIEVQTMVDKLISSSKPEDATQPSRDNILL